MPGPGLTSPSSSTSTLSTPQVGAIMLLLTSEHVSPWEIGQPSQAYALSGK